MILPTASRSRFAVGVSGQAVARVVAAVGTIILVPLFIRAWGVEGYGEWIALTALAAYLAYSNFGLVTTASNEIIMALAADDAGRACRAFQMGINLSLYVVAPILVALSVALCLSPLHSVMRLSFIDERAFAAIVALSAALLLLQTLRGVFVAPAYALGKYGASYYLASALRTAELTATVVAVVGFHARPATVMAISTLGAAVELMAVHAWSRRLAPWARLDLGVFDIGWIRTHYRSTAGFSLYVFATQGVLVVGPKVLLSMLLGNGAVAIYAIYGTAMRLVDQLLLAVVLPLEVEISRLIGRADRDGVLDLVVVGTQLSWLILAGVSLLLLAAGPEVFRLWTHGRVVFSRPIMALYLILAACNLFGRVSAHALISANRLRGLGVVILLCAALSLAVGGTLAVRLGVLGMVAGAIVGEALSSIAVVRSASHWLGRALTPSFLRFRQTRDVLRGLMKRPGAPGG